jgi:hypothetical protein
VGEAWATVVDWVRSGLYRTAPARSDKAKFLDGIVQGLGGYQVIAQCADDKLSYLERRFAEHYERTFSAQETRAALPHLMAGGNSALHPRLADSVKRLAKQQQGI